MEKDANPGTEDVPARSSSRGYLFGLGDHALSAAGSPSVQGVRSRVRAAPCAIHGEECDGSTTTKFWLTEETKRGMGFVEGYPMVDVEGRLMIDWVKMLSEE